MKPKEIFDKSMARAKAILDLSSAIKNSATTIAGYQATSLDEVQGDLVRASLAFGVSAFDRYCHDIVLNKAISNLSHGKTQGCKKFLLPVSLFYTVLASAKQVDENGVRKNSRPLTLVRAALQDDLFKIPIQNPNVVADKLNAVGIVGIWDSCSITMGQTAKDIQSTLGKITKRRNQIVHECDVKVVKRGGKGFLNEISRSTVSSDLSFLERLVNSIEQVV